MSVNLLSVKIPQWQSFTLSSKKKNRQHVDVDIKKKYYFVSVQLHAWVQVNVMIKFNNTDCLFWFFFGARQVLFFIYT